MLICYTFPRWIQLSFVSQKSNSDSFKNFVIFFLYFIACVKHLLRSFHSIDEELKTIFAFKISRLKMIHIIDDVFLSPRTFRIIFSPKTSKKNSIYRCESSNDDVHWL